MIEHGGMRIGIDIGGSKIAAVILDQEGREQARHRSDMPRDYSGTVEKISETVGRLEGRAQRARRIGISMPGVINGASELLGEVFGDAGRHARSAVGVPVLPLDSPVEVEVVFTLA